MAFRETQSLLIVPLGAKPQLVTLALDELRAQTISPIKVVVLHTDRDRPATADALARLQDAWDETHATISLRLLELQHPTGEPLADVTAPAEVAAAFQALYAEVRMAKLAERAVHLLRGQPSVHTSSLSS